MFRDSQNISISQPIETFKQEKSSRFLLWSDLSYVSFSWLLVQSIRHLLTMANPGLPNLFEFPTQLSSIFYAGNVGNIFNGVTVVLGFLPKPPLFLGVSVYTEANINTNT
jgi:hypothetical protein